MHRRRIVPSPHCSLFCCVMLIVIHTFLPSLCTVNHGSERHCNQSLMIRAIALIHRRRIVRRRRIVSPPPHYVSAAALCKRRRIVSPSPHCSLFCCVMLNVIHIFLPSSCTVHHGSELHCNQSLMIRAIALIHRRRIVSPPPHWVTAAALSHRRRIVSPPPHCVTVAAFVDYSAA